MPKQTLVDTGIASRANMPAAASTVVALNAIGASLLAQSHYEALLDELVFSSTTIENRKQARRHKKALSAQSTIGILATIWKESALVSDEELGLLGMARSFDHAGDLNCYSLARAMVAEGADYSSYHKHVEEIVRAAVAYGLVEKLSGRGKGKTLFATPLLHALMVQTGTQYQRCFSDLAFPGPEDL